MTGAVGRRVQKIPRIKVPSRVPTTAEPYDEPSDLSEAQKRSLEDLRVGGIAVSTFDELVGDQVLWHELEVEMEEFVERARELTPKLAKPTRKDEFLIRRWTPDSEGTVAEDPRIPSDSPWFRFAACDMLLDVVNSYLRVYTKLVGIDNWYTVPYPAAHERVASQRWHRDPEDVHVVKCFLYFSEVDEDAGPFEYVRGSADGGRYGNLWPWGAEDGWYPPQEELEARTAQADRIALTGPKGTLILCDTGGFHRGGHAQSKPRLLSTHTYISAAAEREKMYHEVVWSEGGELSRQSRYALTL